MVRRFNLLHPPLGREPQKRPLEFRATPRCHPEMRTTLDGDRLAEKIHLDRLERNQALALIRELCLALDAEGVAYSHWKSNWRLHRWAKGEGDLDLLVARNDAQRFASVLCRLGFKEAFPPRDHELPGITNYYGFDTEANRFVHIHTHFKLVLGHDLTKNYHLPIEEPFLESTVQRGLFPVPAPEFELIVFVLRMVLKYSVLDGVLRKVLCKPDASANAVHEELECLEAQADAVTMYATLEQHLPFIDAAFFDTCVRSLRKNCSGWKRLAARQQLHRRLKPHARNPQVIDSLLKLERRVMREIQGHILRRSSRKRLANRGTLIALVGGDGAGKSTSVDDLYDWLSKRFDTRRVHLGKPPKSPMRFAVAITRRAHLTLKKLSSQYHNGHSPVASDSSGFPGYLELLRAVCIAHDRYRLYIKARRFASNGGLMICDRYPIPEIKLMDGGKGIQSLDTTSLNRLRRFLLEVEASYYRQIMPPDLLIVLRVDPEIAVQRKTDEDSAYVRARSRVVWEQDWTRTRARVIDAGRPKGDMLKELRSLIWAEL